MPTKAIARGRQLAGDPLEPRAVEVAAAQVARAGRRAVRGVRDAVAELEERELLLRIEEPRREARVVEQPPEVVARVREVRGRRGRDAARIDAAEDAAQVRGEDVRDVRDAFGHEADSVADASATSRCRPTSSASAPPAGPSREGRSGGARSSCGMPASSPHRLQPGPRWTPTGRSRGSVPRMAHRPPTIENVRERFMALRSPLAFFDGPAGRRCPTR